MKRVPTQDCLRKSFNTHLRKMLTRRLRPKQNSLRDFSTVPFLYKPNHLQKKRGSFGGAFVALTLAGMSAIQYYLERVEFLRATRSFFTKPRLNDVVL